MGNDKACLTQGSFNERSRQDQGLDVLSHAVVRNTVLGKASSEPRDTRSGRRPGVITKGITEGSVNGASALVGLPLPLC